MSIGAFTLLHVIITLIAIGSGPPHRHPEDRIYTVISGVFYIGLGDKFDSGKVKAYPPGSVIVLPGDTPHFHWAKSGEYVTQVSAVGPLGLEYLDSADDPRH
jgi:quercetin dioxygenase-like cupin family protein